MSETLPPPAAAPPAPTPTPAPTPPNGGGPPNNGAAAAPERYVSEERLARLIEDANRGREAASALAAAQADAMTWRTKYDTARVLGPKAAQYPDLASDEVQDFIVEQHAKHAATAGDKAKPFAEWLADQETSPSPLLRPYLTQQAPGTPPPAPARQPPPSVVTPPVRTDSGAAPPPGIKAKYSHDEINEITRSGKFTGATAAAILRQQEAEGLIRNAEATIKAMGWG